MEPVLIDLIQRYGGVVLENCDFSMITHLVLPDQCKTKGNNNNSSASQNSDSSGFQQSEAALFRQCIVRGRFTVTIAMFLSNDQGQEGYNLVKKCCLHDNLHSRAFRSKYNFNVSAHE